VLFLRQKRENNALPRYSLFNDQQIKRKYTFIPKLCQVAGNAHQECTQDRPATGSPSANIQSLDSSILVSAIHRGIMEEQITT